MAAADGGIGVAYLHAHVSNAGALEFYEKKLGFARGATARGYYRRLDPPDAVVLWRRLLG
jgi:N-alpha-acetyltransferase 50